MSQEQKKIEDQLIECREDNKKLIEMLELSTAKSSVLVREFEKAAEEMDKLRLAMRPAFEFEGTDNNFDRNNELNTVKAELQKNREALKKIRFEFLNAPAGTIPEGLKVAIMGDDLKFEYKGKK